jgi:hypothetical protein
VFCPNCGTQNESAATPCKKCGFKLSGISVPKFKGTMVLNSDQTVAEMIEGHRKKQEQGAAPDKSKARASEPAPRRNPGSSSPPSSLGGPRGPVLQPPRVAAPTRGRMGGTMLGVAPQVGGYAPPGGAAPAGGAAVPPAAAPKPVEPSSPAASRSETARASEAAVLSPAPPVAGAEASAGSGQPQAPSPSEASPEPALARTRPLAATPGAADEAAPAEAQDAPPPAAAEPIEPAPAAPRVVAATAPLPQAPEAAESTPAEESPAQPVESKPPSPPRLRPLDIVLIIFTCGLYGLVLWAKQRKPAA